MENSRAVCRHDLSEQSTLMWTIRALPPAFEPESFNCWVCHCQLARDPAHLALFLRARSMLRRASASFDWRAEASSSSSPTGSSSSSPEPTSRTDAQQAATSGRVDCPPPSPSLSLHVLPQFSTLSKPSSENTVLREVLPEPLIGLAARHLWPPSPPITSWPELESWRTD